MSDPRSLDLYRRDVADARPMTAPEERALFARYHAGDASAAHEIVVRSQRYVYRCAAHYSRGSQSIGDMIQEANAALMRGIVTYEPTRGIRWMSYAGIIARRAIQDYLASVSRIANSPQRRTCRVAAAHARGAETAEALTIAAGVSHRVAGRLLAHVAGRDVAADDEATGADAPQFDLVAEAHRTAAVRDAMAILTERERDVVERRVWGEETLASIGESYGVTSERVRQIQERAYDKLRARLADHREAA